MPTESMPLRFHIRSLRTTPTGVIMNTQDVNYVFNTSVTKAPNFSDWKERIATGRSATTQMSGVVYTVRARPDTGYYYFMDGTPAKPKLQYIGTGLGTGLHTALNGLTLPSTTVMAASMLRAKNKATVDFVADYKRQTQRLQALVSLGEIGETVRGLASPLKSLFKGVNDVVTDVQRTVRKVSRTHRNWRALSGRSKASIILKAATNTWLEGAFALLPLASDVEGAAEALADIESRGRDTPFKPLKGRGVVATATVTPVQYSMPFLGGSGLCDVVAISEASSIKRGACMSYRESLIGRTVQSFGLTVEEFVPSLYDLVPGSFLLDYFSNVGDIISSWSYQNVILSRWEDNELYSVTRRANNWRNNATTQPGIAQYVILGGAYGSVRKIFRHVPSRRDFLTVSDVKFKIPGTGTKWLNIAALANSFGGLRDTTQQALRL